MFNLLFIFYPRSPCGERLWVLRKVPILGIFLSTLSLRRATKLQHGRNSQNIFSIHALLAESDLAWHCISEDVSFFYPRSPCGERQTVPRGRHIIDTIFYPRSPCGERPPPYNLMIHHTIFYPRSPCGERPEVGGSNQTIISFLSTLSLRRATIISQGIGIRVNFSIHALLAESDRGQQRSNVH